MCASFAASTTASLANTPGLGERRLVHEVVRRMINYIATDLIQSDPIESPPAARPQSTDDVRAQPTPSPHSARQATKRHVELMMFLREHLYRHYKVRA